MSELLPPHHNEVLELLCQIIDANKLRQMLQKRKEPQQTIQTDFDVAFDPKQTALEKKHATRSLIAKKFRDKHT